MADHPTQAPPEANVIADGWLKHFITTLAIANGGAFATLATALLKIEDAHKLAPHVVPAMVWFGWGMVIAGLLPVFVWAHYKADAVLTAIHEKGEYPAKALSGFRGFSEYIAVVGALLSMFTFGNGVLEVTTAAGSFLG